MQFKPLIIKKLRSGLSPMQIRTEHPQIDPSQISYWRAKLGIPPFKRGRKKGHGEAWFRRNRTVRKLKSSGMTYAEIGRKYGVSRQRAQQYLMPPEPVNAASKCEVCGDTCRLMNRHHTDYSCDQTQKLCVKCHCIAHSENIIGHRFGCWTVIALSKTDRSNAVCRCDCGTIRTKRKASRKHWIGCCKTCPATGRSFLSHKAKRAGIKISTVWHRINTYHWSVEKALKTPPQKRSK